MADQFVGEIRVVGFNFPPTGWAYCDGQLMSISQNTALFSLLGTFYGGDGKSTFALPNFQGNVPIAQGQGSGLSDRFIGETSGSQNVTLISSETPNHTHPVNAGTSQDQSSPNNTAIGQGQVIYKNPGTANLVSMNQAALATAGNSAAHNNMMPYLVLNFVIALQGIFPSRA